MRGRQGIGLTCESLERRDLLASYSLVETFSYDFEGSPGDRITSAAILDANLDGSLDLLVGTTLSGDPGNTYIGFNTGSGSLEFLGMGPNQAVYDRSDGYFNGGGLGLTYSFGDLGDLGPTYGTGSSHPEVILDAGRVISFGSGNSWQQVEQFDVPNTFTSIAIVDADRDGRSDLVYTWYLGQGDNRVAVSKQLVDGNFSTAGFTDYWFLNASRRDFLHFDRDQYADLLLLRQVGGGTPEGSDAGETFPSIVLELWRGSSTGVFQQSSEPIIVVNGQLVAVGDLNGDGRQDVLLRSGNGSVLSVYAQNPDGSMTNVQNLQVAQTPSSENGSYFESVVPLDFTGDGRSDVAVWTPQEGLKLYAAGADGTLTLAGVHLGTAKPNSMRAGDFNGDGRPELLVFDDNAPRVTAYKVSSAPPTVTITRSSAGTLKIGSSDTITFTLSEAAADFDSSDVTTTGGTLSNFSGSGTTYSATFSPNAAFSGTATVAVAAGTFTDAVGNANDAGGSLSIPVDTVAPTIAITRNGSITLKIGSTDTITFTLSEAATDFVANDVTATGGTLSNFSGSGTAYSATFTPAADFLGAATVAVSSATFTDAASNSNIAAPTLSVPVDTVRPTIAITRAGSTTLKIGSIDTITFTLSEAATDFVANDVTTIGGTLSNFSGSGTTYSASFSPNADFSGDAAVAVSAGTFTDGLGNANATSGSLSIPVDTVTPTIAITRAGSTTLKIGSTDTITFTLSEASNTFTDADVTVIGGTLSSLVGSGTVYTATFTPNADFLGTATVAVGTFTDAVGNANASGGSLSIPVDTVAPTIAITRAGSTTLKIGSTDTITFTLSEASTAFTAADVTVIGGTLSPLVGSGTVYTATFTPNADFLGTATVAVAVGTFTDAVGNANASGGSLSIPVDTTRPLVMTFGSPLASGKYGVGSNIVLTATTSETVAAGGAISVTLNTGATLILAANSAGKTLVGTYVVRLGEQVNRLRVNSFAILADLPVIDSVGNVLADTTVPPPDKDSLSLAEIAITGQLQAFVPGFGNSVNDPAVRSGEIRSIRMSFNAPVTGFTMSALTLRLNNRSVSLRGARLVGSGSNYVLTLPPGRTAFRGKYTLEIASPAIKSGSTKMTSSSIVSWLNKPMR